jgi:hypothetical protein
MGSRWIAAAMVAAGLAAPVRAQPVFPRVECDRPAELPPLLAVPPAPMPPGAGPRGPSGDYDPGYFYLPERAPERSGLNVCGPAGRLWLGAGLELAWMKPAQAPALLRAGSANGPVAYGGERLAMPMQAGLSIAGGFWMDQEHSRGFDASLLLLPSAGSNSAIVSNGAALLLPTAGGGAFPLADPVAGSAGAFQAGFSTRFTSADVNYRNNLLCTPDARLDALVGYRFADVGDNGSIYGKRLGPDGEIVRFRDDISARNQFHGGQIGLAGEYRIDRWFIGGTGKIAFGAVFTDTDLEGKFRVNGTVVPVGFYARPGVNGPLEHSHFAVMPAVGLTLGRQVGEHSRVTLGYNFLYLNNIIRAADVIDPAPTGLNSNPQAPLAAATVRRDAAISDFWVQALNLGFEWRY